MTGLILSGARAGDVGSWLRGRPGQTVNAVADRRPHERVPRRMVYNLIAPLSVTVVGS